MRRDVRKAMVAVEFVEPVRKAAWLTDIDLVDSVVINVPDSDAIAAVDIDAGCGVEAGAPVRNAFGELIGKGGSVFESGGGYVAKPGLGSGGEVFFEGLEGV